jgi:hypothetical protein
MTKNKETGEKKPEENSLKPAPTKNQPPDVDCLLAKMKAKKKLRKEDQGS